MQAPLAMNWLPTVQGVDKSGAGGIQVKSRSIDEAETVLDDTGGGRHQPVRSFGGDDDQVDVAGGDACILHRTARQRRSQVGSRQPVRNMPLVDVDARGDPFFQFTPRRPKPGFGARQDGVRHTDAKTGNPGVDCIAGNDGSSSLFACFFVDIFHRRCSGGHVLHFLEIDGDAEGFFGQNQHRLVLGIKREILQKRASGVRLAAVMFFFFIFSG